MLTAVFAGDVLLTGFWGIAMNLNAGGLGDNTSATATKILNTSSFTVNTKSSGTSTTFDKTLFAIRNSGDATFNGNVTINGTGTRKLILDDLILDETSIMEWIWLWY